MPERASAARAFPGHPAALRTRGDPRSPAARRGAVTAGIRLALLAAAAASPVAAADLPEFDFTRAEVVREWEPTHHVAAASAVADGLAITIEGDDPFVTGPARDYPDDVPLRMRLRIMPSADGMVQVFFFRDRPGEERSVVSPVRAGRWNDVRALLPPLGQGARLRIDPPGRAGTAVVAQVAFEPAGSLPAPDWPPHAAVDTSSGPRLVSGPLALEVAAAGFALAVDGRRVAASHARPLAGYRAGGRMRWVELSAAAAVSAEGPVAGPRRIDAVQTIRDADGGTWRLRRRFTPGREPGTIDVEVSVGVDEDREVAFLPLVLMVAHEGTPRARQGVFPGLEYLDGEPSSSEADLVGPPARRQVPASHAITFPLMAVAHGGAVVGLAWDHTPALAAVFDSPDRSLASGGHLLGVLAPGSDTLNRHAGDLMPIDPVPFKAGASLSLRATLIGLPGDTVTPAVRTAVRARGLPPVPAAGGFDDYVAVAAAGWLDSGIRVDGLFRHAVAEAFRPRPSADAAVFTAWLAGHVSDPAVRRRLEEASTTAAAAVAAAVVVDAACVGHVRQPVQALVLGRVDDAVAEHAATARRLLAAVRPDGTVAYRPGDGGVDYGRTHDADHASGLSACTVADAIEAARFAGDAELLDAAVSAVRRLARTYAGGVPRGAQSWEIPLHAPDILAAAHLVRALTAAHELTGDRGLLAQAVDWAWTGLPFVYLVDPVGTGDGPYGSVPVFAATSWTAPVWIGRPVQWCGLVYAHALYRLARHDPTGPWRQVADGITAAGIRYTWPAAGRAADHDAVERQGLLPDAWDVRTGLRLDPPINPGTLQACAVEFFRRGPLVDCRGFPFAGGRVIVHAAGAIEPAVPGTPGGTAADAAFTVSGWPRSPHAVLVTGLPQAFGVTIDDRPVELVPPHRVDPAAGRLVLMLDAARPVAVRLVPAAAVR